MAAITVSDLTAGPDSLTGTGVFDELMKAVEAHVKEEYSKGRIKGSEYATVYLGALQAVMDRSLQFLLQQQKIDLESQLLQEQIETENLNQLQITEQTQNLIKQRDQIEAQTALVNQQTANAITENTVLVAQECKLRAEFDLLSEQKLKAVAETALLNQKKVTEKAQTDNTGVDPDSVVGKQNGLYTAQTNGFTRDAEQKAAKLMADVWSVQRTTDNGKQANVTNKLDDANIGRAIDKLLAGVNA